MGVCAYCMRVIVLVCMCVFHECDYIGVYVCMYVHGCDCIGVYVCMYVHGCDRIGVYAPRHACIGQRTLSGVCSLLPLETGSLVSAASPSFPG